MGLTLGALREHCRVVLTDLGVASEITERNIAATPAAPTSSTEFRVLDWDEEIPRDLLRGWDVFVVADCTYNIDAAPALVKVLGTLMRANPKAVLVLAHKKRHEAEQGFFEMMEGLEVVERKGVVIGSGDDVEEAGQVDLYTIRLQDDVI